MHKLKLSKIVAAALAVMLMMSNLFSLNVYAAVDDSDRDHEGKKNASEDVDFWNDINIDQSFAYQIRMATNYANRMASGNVSIGGEDYDDKLNVSNIGVFFGYTSGEINTDILYSPSTTRGGNASASSINYSKQLLLSYGFNKSPSPASDYGNYGLTLNLMGFDSTGSAAENQRRGAFGLIALGAYYAAGSVNSLFEMMFDTLESTNPFQFFKDINSTSTAGQTALASISNKAHTASEESGDALIKLSEYFSAIYNAFTDFAWAIAIPLALVFIVVAFFLTRRGRYSAGSNIKKFVIRVLFIAIGIPILGSAYTQTLDALKDSRAMSDDYITQAVSSTFIDFGEWVENQRLAPGDNNIKLGTIGATTDTGMSSGDAYIPAYTWLHIREWCADINQKNKVFGDTTTQYLRITDTGTMLKDYMYEPTAAQLSIDANGTNGNMDMTNKEAILAVITKYMHGTKYTAEMFETGTVGNMIKRQQTAGSTTAYGDMLALSCDKYSFSQKAERQVHGLQGVTGDYYNPATPDKALPYSEVAKARFNGTDFAGVGYNIWNNGTLNSSEFAASPGGTGGAPVYGREFSGTTNVDGTDRGLDPYEKFGLSTMSTYTYLTTQFTQKGLIVYGDAPSDYTQDAHYAVNLIGGSYIMQFAFFINMITVLVSYFLLAVIFVFKTAFDVLFKGIQLMGHALLAAVGFYKSIGTAICMTVSMIAQLFTSVIFFSFLADLMFIVTTIFDHFFKNLFETLGGGTVAFASNLGDQSGAFKAEILVITSNLLSSLVIVFFLAFAIRWRSVIMNSINSAIERIVGTLLGEQLTGASDGGTSGMLRGALNDTMNVAGAAATLGAGVGLVNGLTDMGSDLSESAAGEAADIRPLQGESFNKEPITAADGAVQASVGAGFDGGIGKTEGDAEVDRSEAFDVLQNGVGDRTGSADSDMASTGSDKNVSLDKNADKNVKDAPFGSYYYGGTAAENAEGVLKKDENGNVMRDENGNALYEKADTDKSGSDTANNGTYVDENGDSIIARNGKGDTKSESETDESGLVVGVDTKGGLMRNKTDKTKDNIKNDTSGTATADNISAGTASTTDNKTANATDNAASVTNDAADNKNAVESAVTEDEQGTLWSQTNSETGTTTAARFDASRGLVLGMTNADGTVSDVAIGLNGISTATTDEAGNKSVVQVSKDGMQTTYDGVDGTSETTTATFDGLNSNIKTVRTDANGNTEEITRDANGTTVSKTETAADGSTKTLTTDENGVQTITENNATTGYEATETIAADGSSVKTESVNGVTTVTNTGSDGTLTSQTVTKTDANGNEITTSYSVQDDGSVSSSVTANGVTDKTITAADGSRTEVQSVVRSDGSVVETTTEYGTGENATAGITSTVIKSANGMETLQTSNVTTGTDSVGTYTSTVTTNDAGSTEVKDYGNGNVVTTETSANGNTSVITAKSNGSSVITETDATTGNVTTTSLSSDGTGNTIVKNSAGETVSETKLSQNSDGVTSYSMASGGSVTMSTVGEGANAERVFAQSYATGGQTITSTNIASGSQAITSTGSFGEQSVTNFDAKSGETRTSFVQASGNSGQSVTTSGGDYQQEIHMVNGGSQSISTSGSGANMTETVTKIDAAGNQTVVQSTGGKIQRVEAMTSGSASFVQEQGDNGSVVTRQVLESGSVITKTTQANGDYVQETANANGSKSYIESTGGVVTSRDVSITGIETTALRSGSASSETVSYGAMNVTQAVDNATGQSSQVFTTSSGQAFTIANDGNGGTKTVVELGDGNYGSYMNNADGSAVNIIRNANGSGRIENLSTGGVSSVVYTDTSGNPIVAPQGADTFNNVMAQAVTGVAGVSQNMSIPTANQNVIYTTQYANAASTTQAQTSGNINFSAMQQGTMEQASSSVLTGSASSQDIEVNDTVNVTSHHKVKTTFLENLFGGMVKNEADETMTASNDSVTTQRKLNAVSKTDKLQRNTGAGMGDYATRKSGSASNNKK